MFLSQARHRRIPLLVDSARIALCCGAAWLAPACTTDSASSVLDSSTGGETAQGGAAPILDAGKILPATCAQCSQAHQGDCHELAQQCSDDPSCKRILDCTFPSDTAGCGLDRAGGKCTRACLDMRCSDAPSGELYLQLEQCLYCDEPCASACESYCKRLGPEKGPGACDAAAGGAAHGGAGGVGGAAAGAGGFGVGDAGASGFGGVGGDSGGAGTSPGGGPGASAGAAGSTAIAPVAGASGNAGSSG